MIIKVLLPLALIHIYTRRTTSSSQLDNEKGGARKKERLERETISFILIFLFVCFFVILSLIGSLLLRH